MRRLVSMAVLLLACDRPQARIAATDAAIAHAGVGSPPGLSDGPRKAVDAALAALEAGADPLDAAVAGAVVLEDDPRFNAGTGSRVRIDGATVQMDASLMRSDGKFAAVAAIERVRNPIRVARAVMDTPHLFLAGEGATAFARTLGMPVARARSGSGTNSTQPHAGDHESTRKPLRRSAPSSDQELGKPGHFRHPECQRR